MKVEIVISGFGVADAIRCEYIENEAFSQPSPTIKVFSIEAIAAKKKAGVE